MKYQIASIVFDPYTSKDSCTVHSLDISLLSAVKDYILRYRPEATFSEEEFEPGKPFMLEVALNRKNNKEYITHIVYELLPNILGSMGWEPFQVQSFTIYPHKIYFRKVTEE